MQHFQNRPELAGCRDAPEEPHLILVAKPGRKPESAVMYVQHVAAAEHFPETGDIHSTGNYKHFKQIDKFFLVMTARCH